MTQNLNDPESQQSWNVPKCRRPQNLTAPNLENPEIQPWKARAKGGRAVIFMIFFGERQLNLLVNFQKGGLKRGGFLGVAILKGG